MVQAVSKRLSKFGSLKNIEPRLSIQGQCLIALGDPLEQPGKGTLWLHNLFLASSLAEPYTDGYPAQMSLENAYITNCNLASAGSMFLKNAFLEGAQPPAKGRGKLR
jgi:hypothetical protein